MPRDHLAMAEMDAVELADRDAARARLDVSSSSVVRIGAEAKVFRDAGPQTDDRLQRRPGSGRGLGERDQTLGAGQAHDSRPLARNRDAVARTPSILLPESALRDKTRERLVQPDDPLGVGIGHLETPRSRCA